MLNKRYGGEVCTPYRDLREMLDRTDIDAVTIATPDFGHTPIMIAALKAGIENAGNEDRADLKLMNTTLKEMRFTSKVFGPYRNARKVTVFGSARTQPDDPVYEMARLFGTDGVRVIANDDLTPELAFRLGEAAGHFLGDGGRGRIRHKSG